MEGTDDDSSKPFSANEPELDLYTIPSYSSWFSWDEIHETEKTSLKEFFDGSSISRTPKIYKEYRDFIISKYREEPSRRLTFTEVRKALIGDVSLIRRVFCFLERWGLINFSASLPVDDHTTVPEYEDRLKVKFEEGAPNGVRVVALPNSSKVVSLPPIASDHGEVVENGFRLPPLSSYADVFGNLMRHKGYVCGNCGEDCGSGYYKSSKGSFLICVKCFKDGKYGENNSIDDFNFNDCINGSGNHKSDVWTDAETLLLLESVLKHGDDWALVAQNVRTKSKLNCISRLIQLPFGDLMLGSTNGKDDGRNTNGNMSSVTQVHSNSIESQETIKTEDQCQEHAKETEKIKVDETQEPPLKRHCVAAGNGSLMKQVALLSTTVGPHVAAAAAEAALTTLCDEDQISKDFFEGGESNIFKDLGSSNEPERVPKAEDLEIGRNDMQSDTQNAPLEKNPIPLTFQIRAAIATALGSAAARAKLFADQEDREIEHLMAIIIETQLRKMHCKIKHFEELELIMEKEYTQIEELTHSITAERIDILRRVFNAGISRWKDHTNVKSWTGTVF